MCSRIKKNCQWIVKSVLQIYVAKRSRTTLGKFAFHSYFSAFRVFPVIICAQNLDLCHHKQLGILGLGFPRTSSQPAFWLSRNRFNESENCNVRGPIVPNRNFNAHSFRSFRFGLSVLIASRWAQTERGHPLLKMLSTYLMSGGRPFRISRLSPLSVGKLRREK